jgi:hypothetical protein
MTGITIFTLQVNQLCYDLGALVTGATVVFGGGGDSREAIRAKAGGHLLKVGDRRHRMKKQHELHSSPTPARSNNRGLL